MGEDQELVLGRPSCVLTDDRRFDHVRERDGLVEMALERPGDPLGGQAAEAVGGPLADALEEMVDEPALDA